MAITAELAKVLNAINKKMGADTVVLGSDIIAVADRFTTGSVAVDVSLGGGWPANQWHEVIGEASNGKTALALKTIAANQKRDPNFTTVWVAAEEWVPGYAEMCGVDTSRVYVVSTNIMEMAYEAVIEFTESKAVDCIVIDSLPALVPSSEDEKQMEESTVGRTALLTNKFFRKVGKASKRSLTEAERPFIGIVINQWRSKIGVMYGDPRTTPGGLGKDYAFFTRMEVRRDEWIEAGTGQEKRRIGQSIKVRIIKNKSAPPSQTATVDFYFANGGGIPAGEFDFAKEIVAMGIINKVIVRAGAYYRYAGRQWQGQDGMLASIREELDLKEALERDVLDSIKAGSKHVAVESDED
jgi:recombination protein RecA